MQGHYDVASATDDARVAFMGSLYGSLFDLECGERHKALSEFQGAAELAPRLPDDGTKTYLMAQSVMKVLEAKVGDLELALDTLASQQQALREGRAIELCRRACGDPVCEVPLAEEDPGLLIIAEKMMMAHIPIDADSVQPGDVLRAISSLYVDATALLKNMEYVDATALEYVDATALLKKMEDLLANEEGRAAVSQAIEKLILAEDAFDQVWVQADTDSAKIAFRDTWLPIAISQRLQHTLIATGRAEEALQAADRCKARAFVALLVQQSQIGRGQLLPHVPQSTYESLVAAAVCEKAAVVYYSCLGIGVQVWVVSSSGVLKGCRTLDKPCRIDRLEGSIDDIVRSVHTTLVQTAAAHTHSVSSDSDAERAPQTGKRVIHPFLASRHLESLHTALVGPIQDLFADEQTLLFVPDGVISLVPFAALRDPELGQYLIQRYCVRQVPSLDVLEVLQSRQKAKALESKPSDHIALAVAVSEFSGECVDGEVLKPLASVPAETRGVVDACRSRGMQVTTLFERKASKSDVLHELEKCALAHFATHGSLGTGALVLLANDGVDLLGATDIYKCKMSADLVVLSACSSSCGTVSADGVVGLTRSFLAAGASSVLGSLWNIDDDGTRVFMKSFYNHLMGESPKPACQALQATMCDMIEANQAPWKWAPFILSGLSTSPDALWPRPGVGSKSVPEGT